MSTARGALPRIGRNDEALRAVNRLQRLAFVLQEQPARVAPDESTLRRAGFVRGEAHGDAPSFAEMMGSVEDHAGRRVDRGSRVVPSTLRAGGRLVAHGQDGGGD
ncbi:MAG: hypothetical protein M1522_00310 [Actinobacteria bacterium]|nr:hypothetical protein [Actinomycetota bacterium]